MLLTLHGLIFPNGSKVSHLSIGTHRGGGGGGGGEVT